MNERYQHTKKSVKILFYMSLEYRRAEIPGEHTIFKITLKKKSISLWMYIRPSSINVSKNEIEKWNTSPALCQPPWEPLPLDTLHTGSNCMVWSWCLFTSCNPHSVNRSLNLQFVKNLYTGPYLWLSHQAATTQETEMSCSLSIVRWKISCPIVAPTSLHWF